MVCYGKQIWKTVSPTQYSLVACISLCRVGASALSPIHVNLSVVLLVSPCLGSPVSEWWLWFSLTGLCVLKKEVSLTEVWTIFICGYGDK